MTPKPRNITKRHYRAMTILEMVIAMSIMALVFSVIAPLIKNIQTSWASKEASAETLQNVRVLIEHLNRNLAKAMKITSVSSPTAALGFVEYLDNLGNTMRYEVANGFVRFGQAGNLSDLAGPVSQLRFSCYALNNMDTTTTDVTAIRFVKADATLDNAASLGQDKNLTAQAYIQTNGNVTEETLSQGPGVAVKNWISYGGSSAIIDSYRSSQGAYNPATAGSNAIVTTNDKSSGDIELYNNAKIKGDVYIGPGGNINNVIKLYSGAQITGTKNVLEDDIAIPNISSSSQSSKGDLTLWGSMTFTISQDSSYDKIELSGNTKLKISGNITVTINILNVGSGTALEILPNSSLTLYVKNSCDIGGSLNANTTDPSKLNIRMSGSGKDFATYGQAQVYALLENPKGNVCLWNQTPFFGRIRCKNLQGDSPIHIDLDSNFADSVGEFINEEILP